MTSQQAQGIVIGFDRGDVSWLRGYCHFLAALGGLCLAVDGQHAFACSAHLLFEKVETPHTILLENGGRVAGDAGEPEQVLQGKTLIPFWRGEAGERGVNLRRVLIESQTLDVIEWV